MTKILPTVGRAVLFTPSRLTGDGRFAHIDGRKPLAAIVAHVRSVRGSWPAVTAGKSPAVTGLSPRDRHRKENCRLHSIAPQEPLRFGPVLGERESGCAFLEKTQIARTPYSVD